MRVIVVSTHRSDKAHYAPLLRLLRGDPRFAITLYAANDFYAKPDYIDSVRPLRMTRRSVGEQRYDAGVVLGDRYEMLLAAMQLVEARIPLLHIHGGEHTYGSLDERWRWAISEIADVHCTATDAAADELRSCVVTKPGMVHVTGAPGLDDISETVGSFGPKVLVLYNPAIDADTTARESRAIADAVVGFDPLTIGVDFIKPNGDRFSDVIPWTGAEFDHPHFRERLKSAHVIVGNSSAGIIEAPSLGTWTVNVGERQAGRPRAGTVFDVPADAEKIRGSIEWGLTHKPATPVNPYGDGHASERIRDVLLTMGVRSSAA